MLILDNWVIVPLLVLLHTCASADEGTELERSGRQSNEIDDRKVVCYYANWAVYRQGDAKFTPQNINPYLCTHLIYAFGGLGKDDTIQPFDSYQDIEKGGYGRFAALKTYNKELKTMLAIGGWNEGSTRFSPLVEDKDRRRTFTRSAITFLRQYNFDGLDFDWEYPTLRQGGRPQDRANYALLVKEMREAFEKEAQQTGKERLLISMAVPASLEYAGQGYDIQSLDENLDFFNLLTYDYHSSQEPAVNHHAPLFRPDNWSEFDFRKDLNIDATIKFYISHGASRHKLVLGIPTYGRSYTLANPDAHGIGSPTEGPGTQGPGTKEDGYLAYYEICINIIENGWDIVTPYPGVMGPYAHKGNQWVGFDNVDIAVEKAFYVGEEGLGGIMFWTIDNDDFRGTCSKTPYPLIESAKEAMFSVQTDLKTKTSVSVSTSTSEQTSVTRLRLTPDELAKLSTSSEKSAKTAKSLNRPPPPPTEGRSEKTVPRLATSTTPAPPTTPSSGPAYQCQAEGFFPHPATCKKYYWCLDTPNQGILAHTFTCPRGLFFNKITDGCDFRRNVDCGDKDDIETEPEQEPVETKVAAGTPDTAEEDSVEDPKSLRDILEIVKAAGGIEGLEKKIEEEEGQKQLSEDRRLRISSKTKGRLSQLLNKVNSAPTKPPGSRGVETETDTTTSSAASDTSLASSTESSSGRSSPPTRPSFLSRLASRRKTLPSEVFSPASASNQQPLSAAPETQKLQPGSPPARSRFLPRASLSQAGASTSPPTPTPTPTPTPINNIRSQFRGLLSRTTTPTPLNPTTTSPEPETPETPDPDTPTPTLLPNPDPENEEAGSKIKIIGAHVEEEEEAQQPLRLGIFKPKDGARERLRETLHGVLEDETKKEGEPLEDKDTVTIAPLSTPTISRNTRLEDVLKSRPRDQARSLSRRPVENAEDNRFVTVDRLHGTTPSSELENQVSGKSDDSGDEGFRPTVPSSPLGKEISTSQPFIPTISSEETASTDHTDHVVEQEEEQQEEEEMEEEEMEEVKVEEEEEVKNMEEKEKKPEEEEDDVNLSEEFTSTETPGPAPTTSRGPQSPPQLPDITGPTDRPARPIFRVEQFPQQSTDQETPRRAQPRKLDGASLNTLQGLDNPDRDELKEIKPVLSAVESLFQQAQHNLRADKPAPEAGPVTSLRSRSRARVPPAPLQPEERAPPRQQSPVPARAPTRNIRPQPIEPFSKVRQPQPNSAAPANRIVEASLPAAAGQRPRPESGEYEYYYDYLDVEDSGHSTDYDLVPLSNKVRILADGLPHCLDVGVFPHPFSCKQFINCFRNPGTGIVGSIYKCPSYLAFDPVGGRCNWVSEIVCQANRK